MTINAVCFRCLEDGLPAEALDRANKQNEVELQERGIAVLSLTMLGRRCVQHIAVTDHRSRRRDFDFLVGEVARIGNELVRRLWGVRLADGCAPGVVLRSSGPGDSHCCGEIGTIRLGWLTTP